MRLAVFCSGFSASNLRLQPWLTLAEVGQRLGAKGHNVTLATDCDASPSPLTAYRFPNLRGTHSAQIARWLEEHKPDRVVVSITPFSLATASWHQHLGREKAWGYLPYALYNWKEFRTSWRFLTQPDRSGYGRNLLVPGWLWRHRLRHRFAAVICQSQRTADRLALPSYPLPLTAPTDAPSTVHRSPSTIVIPPGIDLQTWHPPESTDSTQSSGAFLYLGNTRPIRGYTVMLDAMRNLPAHLKLRVLARGAGEAEMLQLRNDLATRGLADRVGLVGGWQTPSELRGEIQTALAVVLPFVLVPSELPVSVMEIIACGTPVIVSDIDGLPETVGEAGVVVAQGDAHSLASAMRELGSQHQRRAALRAACLRRRMEFADWDTVTDQWVAALRL